MKKKSLNINFPLLTQSHLSRSFSSGKRVTEDRCDFLFSTGEYKESDVRDDWGGLFEKIKLFDLIENHVDDDDDDEENIATRTASSGLGSGGKIKDKEAIRASGLGNSGGGRVSGDIGSALDALEVELAEDLLHNDKETEDDEEESVEEPMQRKSSRAGSIPMNWESNPESSKVEEEERISTHSRRRIRRHRRQRKRKGNMPTYLARKKPSSPPSGPSDSGRSPAGRRRRRHGTRKRLRDSPDSRLREGVSAKGSRRR